MDQMNLLQLKLMGIRCIPSECLEDGNRENLERFEPTKQIFVAIDIDVMDAVCAPGTASSMFGGFWYEEMIDMFEVLVKKAKVIGIVLTEVAPPTMMLREQRRI